MRGCELEEAYPVVPLADRHALSIGITTVARPRLLRSLRRPRGAARHRRARGRIDASIDELLELSRHPVDARPALVPLG